LERLRGRRPEVQGVAFGVEPSSRSYRLPSWIHFELRPTQGRIAALYAACDAWLLGSRSEGFGLPILEAFACRTPVVSTPVGAAAELLAGGGGRLVPMADPAAVAAALEEIIGLSNAAWRSISDRAYETALRHNWDSATDQFEDALLAAASAANTTISRAKPAPTAAV
jgi:glycosyltransferase involved in cell wall biosynthesis